MTTNAKAWVVWIGAAATVTMIARNPFYTVIVLAAASLMMASFGRPAQEGGIPIRKLAILFLVVSATYNALFVHAGDTVLFTLPPWPLIGGPVTLEAIAEGAANGLTLLTMLLVFVTLGAIVPMSELTRLMPAGFRDLGLVLMIAVNYVPETRRHLRRIRDAQAIRGHQLRGFRDWRPLVIPLLVGGLERAMRLSETMVSRGFGSTKDEASRPVEQVVLVVALLASVAGWFIVLWRGWQGWILLGGGLLAAAAVVWARGRRAKRSTFRPQPWRPVDNALLISALLALAVVAVPWPSVDRSTLIWVPYPIISLPALDWVIVLALAGLAAPAVYDALARTTRKEVEVP